MRVLFVGSGRFAVPVLDELHASVHTVCLVVTPPDRPAGRGVHMHAAPVTARARDLGLPLYQPSGLRGDKPAERVRRAAPDVGLTVDTGYRIPARLLSVPGHGFLNAHPSLLPKYRGAAPVQHAILAGETQTGVTVFGLVEDWDAGPVYATDRVALRPDETAGELLARLAPVAARLVLRVLDDLQAGRARPHPQEEAAATQAPRLRAEDGRIDWTRPAEFIARQVRAVQPWPRAFTTLPAKRGKTRRLQILAATPEAAARSAEARPGTVLAADPRKGLLVAAGDGSALRVTRVRPEGRRDMDAAAWVRGARLEPGTLLDVEAGS